MNKDLISPKEAAAILCVTTHTLTNWVRQKKLSVFRTVGGHRRYSLIEVRNMRGIK